MAVALRSQAPWNPTRLHMVPRETDCEEYPEIEAKFSLETYLLREAMLDAKIRPCASLPSGFPQRIDSSVVWSSSTLMPNETLYRLSSNEIEELEEPVKGFNCGSRLATLLSEHGDSDGTYRVRRRPPNHQAPTTEPCSTRKTRSKIRPTNHNATWCVCACEIPHTAGPSRRI